ncbi:hypothetical protein VTK56DRAFT_706 [Thermocarpiscus australiensis]
MADERLLDKVQSLSDLELASLLCLVAREHCLISTEPDSVDDLAEELRLIASRTFNLSSAVIDCHTHTTLDEFATALLVPLPTRAPPSPGNTRSVSSYPPRYEQYLSSAGGPSSLAASYFPSSSSPRVGGPINPSSPSIGTGTNSSSQAPRQPRIANIILAKNLDRAPRVVQIQALELLRTRRIFTRTSVQTAPKQFLFIALVGATSGGQARVTPHLNDFLYLAHWHDPEGDGFPYLDEEAVQTGEDGDRGGEDEFDDGESTSSSHSVVKRHLPSLGARTSSSLPAVETKWPSRMNTTSSRRSSSSGSSLRRPTPTPRRKQPDPEPREPPPELPLFTDSDISLLAQLAQQAHVDVDVYRYQMNVVAFLRTHRAVAGGVSPAATKHFELLAKSLAPLHGLDYVTPSLVALAARKVYLHRIVVTTPERERSMQWGSELGAVAAILEGVGPEDVIEEVLGLVAVPP